MLSSRFFTISHLRSICCSVPSVFFFFFYGYAHHRDLHSFPTRRSSDLQRRAGGDRRRGVRAGVPGPGVLRGERPLQIGRHTSELQSPCNLVCRLLLEKKKEINIETT